jgi:Zn-dependent alcohol dehydrogenase
VLIVAGALLALSVRVIRRDATSFTLWHPKTYIPQLSLYFSTGVAASGHEISTRPFQLVTGRIWKGTAFGGYKSRTDVPKLVRQHLDGNLPIDHFITHVFHGVEKTNDAINAMHAGNCLRAVVHY